MDGYFKYELVNEVVPLENGCLSVVFRNGKRGVFDCKPYFEDPYWKRLADPAFFKLVHLDYGTLTWPDEIDIAPEEVWRDAVPA